MKTATHSKSQHVGSDWVKHIIQKSVNSEQKRKQERLRKDSHKAPDKEERRERKRRRKKVKRKKGQKKEANTWLFTSWATSTRENQWVCRFQTSSIWSELRQLTCEEPTHKMGNNHYFSVTRTRNAALKHQRLPGVLSVPWQAENAGQINSTTSHSEGCGFYLPSPLRARKRVPGNSGVSGCVPCAFSLNWAV